MIDLIHASDVLPRMNSESTPSVQTARDLMPTQSDWHDHGGHYIVAARLEIACMPLGTGLRPRLHRRVSAIHSRTRITPMDVVGLPDFAASVTRLGGIGFNDLDHFTDRLCTRSS
jgi:hypothetical protein